MGLRTLSISRSSDRKIRSSTCKSRSPSQDSQSITSSSQSRIPHYYSPQAPDTDAMSGSTHDLGYANVGATGEDHDAVIACSGCGTCDPHVLRPPDLDAVRVRAVGRGQNADLCEVQVLAAEDGEVCVFAVDRFQVVDSRILDEIEFRRLHCEQTEDKVFRVNSLMKFVKFDAQPLYIHENLENEGLGTEKEKEN